MQKSFRAYGAAFFGMIFGGFTGTESLSSMELLGDAIWLEVPDFLPVAVHQHCVTAYPMFSHMIIGGIQGGHPSNKTYIFNSVQVEWKEGPELNVPRSGASCGVLDDDEKIVVTGGYNNDGYLSSTEVFLTPILPLTLIRR